MPDGPNLPAKQPIRAEVDGNRLEVIERGDARLRAVLELIAGAKTSLNVLMYMFNADEAGDAVRNALDSAACRGVDVKLLIDGFGSAAPHPFLDVLKRSGGDYCVFNPAYGRRYLVRNHQKIIVADERTAIIGGANIDETYLTDSGPEHWRDLWLKIDGREAAVASRYCDALFRWAKRKHSSLRSLRRMTGEFSEWRGPLQWKFSGPLSLRNSWWRSMGRDIRRARRLEMIFAYFAPTGAMIRRIGSVGRRGGARLVMAAKSDNTATIAAARHSYGRLLRKGVEIFEYRPAKLHTKLVIVDDVVYIGSSNFDYRSFYLNLEVMLRIQDAGFAAAMRNYFDRELADCRAITPRLYKRRATVWRRIKWALSHFLVNIMDYTVTRRLNLRA
ncbi:MAG: phospholipase D-like domain-containing protein [Sphingomicrobium sp.]